MLIVKRFFRRTATDGKTAESACRREQNRFKRRGRFWTQEGLGNLAALREAGDNKHWDELWFAA